jgi:hypothetical protein
MKMHLAAIADRRLVDPHQCDKEVDYVLNGLSKIPFLLVAWRLDFDWSLQGASLCRLTGNSFQRPRCKSVCYYRVRPNGFLGVEADYDEVICLALLGCYCESTFHRIPASFARNSFYTYGDHSGSAFFRAVRETYGI